jgi:hypothetical protein
MRRAFVHIGIHKTGSSSIQHALYKHADRLQRSGILYPSVRRNHSHLSILFRDDPAIDRAARKNRLRTPEQIAAYCREMRKRLAASMQQDHDVLVISGEGLSHMSRSDVERFGDWLDGYDVRVIAYLREPGDWASSAAQQRVKAGLTLQRVINKTQLRPAFRHRLRPWAAVFGSGRMSVFDFSVAKLQAGGITAHFADAIDLPEHLKDRVGGVHINQSLSAEAVCQLDEWNRSAAGRLPKHKIAELRKLSGARFTLSSDVLAEIQRDSAEDVEWVRRKFGFSFSASQ